MEYCFIRYPHYVPPAVYEDAINRVVEKLSRDTGVVSLFQIGSVSTPGISDIDLLAVFEDDATCSLNPLEGLHAQDRYLFTHNVNGMSLRHFKQAQRYTLYHNYTLRWGQPLDVGSPDLSGEVLQALKTQIALEFLVTNYIARSVEKKYGIFSIRNLLLSIKAIQYDLEFLNVTSGRFYDLVMQFIAWRNAWFEVKIEKEQFAQWIEAFDAELQAFLKPIFTSRRLYLPEQANMRYARHIRLKRADELRRSHRGVVLPAMLGVFGKKFVRLQHRFNRFEFAIPVTTQAAHPLLEGRFRFMREARAHNQAHLKHFSLPSCRLGL